MESANRWNYFHLIIVGLRGDCVCGRTEFRFWSKIHTLNEYVDLPEFANGCRLAVALATLEM
jgi:hypothetical protein